MSQMRQQVQLPSYEGNQLHQYVLSSLEREPEFHFLRFEFLQRLNIVTIQNELIRLKDRIMAEGATEANTDSLPQVVQRFATAIRDYEYLQGMKETEYTEEQARRERLRQAFDPDDRRVFLYEPFASHYCYFQRDTRVKEPDILRKWLSSHLPRRLAWSYEERSRRFEEYRRFEAPTTVSNLVDMLAQFIVSSLASFFLLVPMYVMVADQEHAKNVVTVSAAIFLFAVITSFFVKLSNFEAGAVLMAYTAVLVVFIGAGNVL